MGFSEKHFDFTSTVLCDDCVLLGHNDSISPYPPPAHVDVPEYLFSPSHRVQRLTVLALAISSALAFFFLLLTYYIILLRFRAFLRRRRSLLSPNPIDPPPQPPGDDDRDPVHHVWYIRTVGLDGPTIDSIAVCEYKPGDGLVDATDCTVCLSEFEEGDLLRLLPKCSHAFHVPCIDRWLMAHVNCPLCRAPIVCAAREDENRDGSSSDAAQQAVLVGEDDGSHENRIGFLQDLGPSSSSPSGGESDRGLVNSAVEENWVTIDLNEDDGFHEQQQQQQHVRRSVSMDASAMAALMATDRKTNIVDCTGKETACATVASSSPQKGPDGFDRCQSTNGMQFFLPRFARGRSTSILPL